MLIHIANKHGKLFAGQKLYEALRTQENSIVECHIVRLKQTILNEGKPANQPLPKKPHCSICPRKFWNVLAEREIAEGITGLIPLQNNDNATPHLEIAIDRETRKHGFTAILKSIWNYHRYICILVSKRRRNCSRFTMFGFLESDGVETFKDLRKFASQHKSDRYNKTEHAQLYPRVAYAKGVNDKE